MKIIISCQLLAMCKVDYLDKVDDEVIVKR